jgi:pimeloyl-ACP methyl ester carboxylesterase
MDSSIMKRSAGFVSAVFFGFSAAAAQAACDVGVYRGNADQEALVVTTLSAPSGAKQRYTFLDGRRGDVTADSGDVQCEQSALRVKGKDGTYAAWKKVELVQTPTRFRSHDTELAGMLYESKDAADGKRKPPLTVFVHGSEKTPGIGSYYPYVGAALGLSVFAYDKRGTGASEGDYTQNFELLGDDAAAALREARRLAAGRYSRAGLLGGSQGGWVAPLAAKRAGADFVAVGFGLVMSPLEEDREQVVSELRRKKYDDAAIAHARIVADAVGTVMASHFTSGYDRVAEVKQRYASAPWLREIEGEFTGHILAGNEADLRRVGPPLLDNLNIIWNYDAVAVIRSLDIPQLWVIAGEDREAPGDITRERLTALKHEGKPIDLYVFPHTDHGMYEFTEDADGTRHTTRITDGYFRLLGDWIKQDVKSGYGRGERVR